jgi:putative Mn2+ efflux pump MntP
MLALLLVAASLGLSNFTASVGIGVSGVDGRTRLRVGLVFGAFETAMPVIGLLLGCGLAAALGPAGHWTGSGLLIAAGLYTLVQAVRGSGGDAEAVPAGLPVGRLLVTGLALSIDNLAVGFALGTFHIALVLAAVVIGAVSVTMSLAGLELGRLLGARAGSRGDIIGGLVLIGVGAAIAAGIL